jgi:hypothetical protein
MALSEKEKLVKTLWRLRASLLAALVLLVMAFPASGWATTVIYPTNYSFESPTLAQGAWTNNVVPGWTLSGGSGNYGGVWYPWFTVPDGNQVAWLDQGTLSQQLSNTIQAYHTYTLDVMVTRNNSSPTYTIQLVAHDGSGDHVLDTISGIATSNRVFQNVHLSYDNVNAYTGSYLKVVLISSALESAFDNVYLTETANPVPIPAAYLLLGSGLLGVAVLRLKRKS